MSDLDSLPLTGNEISMTNVDPKYLIPLFDRLFCCLPERWRHTLRCNMEFQDPSVSDEFLSLDNDGHSLPDGKFLIRSY